MTASEYILSLLCQLNEKIGRSAFHKALIFHGVHLLQYKKKAFDLISVFRTFYLVILWILPYFFILDKTMIISIWKRFHI